MWVITISWVLAILLSVSVLSGICESEPGGPCNEDTEPGDCIPMNQCPEIQMALKHNKTTFSSVTCRIDGSSPLPFVCCPNGKTPKPVEPTAPTIVNRIKETTENSRISVKKCIEYAQYVFKKELSVALIDQQSIEIDGCVKVVEGLIVNGEAVQKGEFPHMALLGYGENNSSLKFLCGGSLISEGYVLTAAHCSVVAKPSYVLLGEHIKGVDTDGETQLIRVAEFIPHPGYMPPAHYFDIAVIKLSRKAVLNPLVRPGCLHSDQPYEHNSVTATGWGQLDYLDPVPSDYLLKVTLGEVNNTYCNRTHKDNVKLVKGFLPDQQICAGKLEGGKDTCQGDSGGPLQVVMKEPYCSYLIVGITSFGKGCALPNTPGVYTRVKYFIQWIEDHVWPSDSTNATTANNAVIANNATNVTITNNSNNATMANNSNNVTVANNSNNATMANNSNNVTAANNSNNVTVANNSNNATMANNSNNVTVANNSNNVTVANNSNNATMANNSNNVTVANNSNNVTVANNSNNVTVANNSNNATMASNAVLANNTTAPDERNNSADTGLHSENKPKDLHKR